MHHVTMDSPIGALTLVADDTGLAGVWFEQNRHDLGPRGEPLPLGTESPAAAVLADTQAQLVEYFAGTRSTFDLPLSPRGTPFQRRVWDGLCDIPHGETISYRELARRLGDVNALRAVGAANGRNPVPIIIPCHRVIGADGSLTGFGGGIERKRWLLTHEGALLL